MLSTTSLQHFRRLVGRCMLAGILLAGFLPLGGAAAALPAATTPPVTPTNAGDSPPAGLSSEAWASMMRQVRLGEYEPVANGDDEQYYAPNRAQGLRLSFGPAGVTTRPRTDGPAYPWEGAPAPRWRFAMRLVGYGQAELPAAEPAVSGNRVEYRRGDVVEWYVNDESGLKQGFTLEAPRRAGFLPAETTAISPAGTAALESRPTGAVLDIVLDTTLTPALSADGATLLLRDAAGNVVLRYSDLAVYDADGEKVAARLELAGSRLRIVIDDAGARYPLTVDPLLSGLVAQLAQGDGAADNYYGCSVAISGDTAVVGAFGASWGGESYRGAAYVFSRNQGGIDNWGLVKKLTAPDAFPDYFGQGIAIDGDTIAVGATNATVGSNYGQGAAYVYERNQGGADNWGQVKRLTAAGTSYDSFGQSIEISGDTIVVGAYRADVSGKADQGAAYVYARNQGGANNWGQVRQLTASDGGANDWYGLWVGIDRDTVIVGSSQADVDGVSDRGAAYIYSRNQGGADNWGQIKKLTTLGSSRDYFGRSVSISGDTIAVGVSQTYTDQGAVCVFYRNAGGADNWGQVKRLTASDGSVTWHFGIAVEICDDTLVVGANGASTVGAAYVFTRNQNGADQWGQVQKLTSPGSAWNNRFGESIAISGHSIVIGEPQAHSGQGEAYLFVESGGVWGRAPALTAGAAYDLFGFAVGISGDTVVVGAGGADVGSNNNQGAAYIFARNQGGADQWGQVKKLTFAEGLAGDQFGWSVAIDGDTAVVGANQASVGGNGGQGAAYIFGRNAGGADNWGFLTMFMAADGAANDQFATSLAISGDVIVVGASWADVATLNNQGAAYVFLRNQGGADTWGQIKKLVASDGVADDYFGASVAVSGYTIVVGANEAAVGGNDNQGAAYVFSRNQGGADNWGQLKKLTAGDGAAGNKFGASVGIASDTIVAGAPYAAVGATISQGAAYIFTRNQGGADNWGEAKKLTAGDGAVQDFFGSAVAIGGDRIVAGAPGAEVAGLSDRGAIYLYARNQDGADQWGQANKLSVGAANDRFGTAAAISFDTIVVGATGVDVGGNENQGKAYIFGWGVPDLRISKSVSQSSPVRGERITYTLVISNVSDGMATGAVVSDTVAAGLTLAGPLTLDPPDAGTAGTPPTVATDLTVGAGSRITVTLPVTVEMGLAIGTVLNNSAAVTCTEVLTPAVSSTVSATVVKGTTATALQSAPNPSIIGQDVTFTVTVSSVPPASGTPTGVVTLTADSAVLASETLTDGTAVFTTATLAPGSHSLTATYGGDADFFGSTSTPALTQVVRAPDLRIAKSVDDAAPQPGERITYTIVISNAGDTAASSWVVSDVLPAQISFIGPVGVEPAGAATPGTPSQLASGASLAVGDAITLTVPVSLPAQISAGTLITNVASITCTEVITPAVSAPNVLTTSKADTTTALKASPNPSVVTHLVTFTATVAVKPPAAGTPAGSVTFYDDVTSLGNKTLSGGVATLQTAGLASGTHTITVQYLGDANYNASTSEPVTQTVRAPDLRIAKYVDEAAPQPGERITYTIVISNAGDAAASGWIVSDDLPAQIGFIGPVGVEPAGAATLGVLPQLASGASLAVGDAITLTVPVSLTAQIAASTLITNVASITCTEVITPAVSDPSVLTTSKADTTTALEASPNPSVLGETVTFTATVAAKAPAAGMPTGNVTFYDGAASLGDDTLDAGGIATLDTASLTPGTHSITAQYAGDSDFNGSTSEVVTQTVQAPDLRIVKSVSQDEPVAGERITYTLVISNAGNAAASGAVVSDTLATGLTFAGPVTLDPAGAGSAGTPPNVATGLSIGAGETVTLTLPISVNVGLTIGTLISNTASVTCTAVVTPVISSEVGVTVAKGDTTTELEASPNPSIVGQTVTFTATVSAVAPATGTPTGSVTFYDGVTSMGSNAVNAGGIATLQKTDLTPGTHSITAAYLGDANFDGSTSEAVSQVVQTPDLSIVKSVSQDDPVAGQRITYTITIYNAGDAAATGAVVSDTLATGLTFAGPVTLDPAGAGTAGTPPNVATGLSIGAGETVTLTLPVSVNVGLPVGTLISNAASVTCTEVITPVVSSEAGVTVAKGGTTTALTSSVNPSTLGQSVTFTARVRRVAPASGTPTGVVTFTVDSAVIVQTLNAGAATYVTSTLAFGSHTIQAEYGGDANFEGSTATPLTQQAGAALGLTKKAERATIPAGWIVRYTLRVTNKGSSPLAQIIVTDTLPASVTFVQADPAGYTRKGRNLVWTLKNVPGGATRELHVEIRTYTTFRGILLNMAQASAGGTPVSARALVNVTAPAGAPPADANAPAGEPVGDEPVEIIEADGG